MGIIEVDLFSEDINQIDHPAVEQFRELLEMAAEEYHAKVTSFDIDHGTVFFSFDNDELTAEILKILQL
jgi:hypothetical protein